MANVEHNTLTGAALHEPKGVAAAAANRVYVSDGVGSGSWTTVSTDVLASTAKAFQAQLLHVRDQKSAGTAGGSFSSGSFQVRTLNTVVGSNEISGSSLASNTISLPAGTYYIEAYAPALAVDGHQARLRNTTDGSTTLVGTSMETADGLAGTITNHSVIKGRFTIAGPKDFQLQHRCDSTRSTDGFGSAANFGEVEIYAEALIWKIG